MDYYDIQHTTNAVASCVVLHNVCEKLGDTCRPEWINSDSGTSITRAPAATATGVDGNANTIHNALKQYVRIRKPVDTIVTC